MERHYWRPIYVHGMSLEGSYLSEATHAQLELFYSLPPDVQAKVYLDDFSIEEVRDSRNYRCNSPYRSCQLRICLYGFFNFDGSIEEYAYYRQHGMCSQCKRWGERRLARRKERLEGIARLNQAIRDDDGKVWKHTVTGVQLNRTMTSSRGVTRASTKSWRWLSTITSS